MQMDKWSETQKFCSCQFIEGLAPTCSCLNPVQDVTEIIHGKGGWKASVHSARAVTQHPTKFVSISQLPCWDRGLLQGVASAWVVKGVVPCDDQSVVLRCWSSCGRVLQWYCREAQMWASGSMNKADSICSLWTVNSPMRWHVPLGDCKCTDPLHLRGWLCLPGKQSNGQASH